MEQNTISRQIAFNRKIHGNVQLLQVQYRVIATNCQTQEIRSFQEPSYHSQPYHNMIPYTALYRYPPLRFSRAAKTPVEANFQISRIEAELGVPTCNNINTVNSVINRKKNDAKRWLISREFPLNKGTLFFKSRNCTAYLRHQLSGLGENFENLGVIEKRQYLNNQDELAGQISFLMLLRRAFTRINSKSLGK